MGKSSARPLVDNELAARFSLSVIELWHIPATAVPFQAAAQSAFLWADYCLDLLEKASPEPQPPACRPGCDCCCYNQVELTIPEALLLGHFLAERLDSASLQPLLARVEESCRRRAGKTKIQLADRRAEFPCPLLEAGQCLAYDVRPLMCRAMHALQVEACRQELADPKLSKVEFYLHRHVIHVSISQGLVDACRSLGYQPGPVDLIPAMQQYLSEPGIGRRWLAGEAVFHDI
jgi:Fe-S-cluster containining protein